MHCQKKSMDPFRRGGSAVLYMPLSMLIHTHGSQHRLFGQRSARSNSVSHRNMMTRIQSVKTPLLSLAQSSHPSRQLHLEIVIEHLAQPARQQPTVRPRRVSCHSLLRRVLYCLPVSRVPSRLVVHPSNNLHLAQLSRAILPAAPRRVMHLRQLRNVPLQLQLGQRIFERMEAHHS